MQRCQRASGRYSAVLSVSPRQVEVGMLALDRPVPPGFDLGVDLLVKVRHCARADPRSPQRFRDVLDAADRNPGQVHLDQGFLDRALAPSVALNDGGLERLAT